jgi:hypothetical protein
MRPMTVACSALAAMLLASCSTLADETTLTRSSSHVDDRLLVRTRTGLAVIEPSGTSVATGTRAIVSPDSSQLFSVSGSNGAKHVTTLDATTGEVLRHAEAPSQLRARVASSDGRLVAFAPAHEAGATPWLPAGRPRTRIAVAATEGAGEIREYDLKGNFEIEGFSTNGKQLFLLEYKPSLNPTRYGLKRLRLDTGRVSPIKEVKQNAPGRMRGTGRVAAFSPTGHELYTLYTQQGPNYAHGGEASHRTRDARGAAVSTGHVYAFVHLLNLEGAWTHCIDLRAPFGTGSVTTHAMAVSPDGERLFVADPSSGGVAVIAPGETKVLRSVTLDLQPLKRGEASATVSPDGTLYLGGGSDVLVIDGETLEVADRWKVGSRISGLAASADGRKLYVGAGRGFTVYETSTGNRTGSVDVPGMKELVEVIPEA